MRKKGQSRGFLTSQVISKNCDMMELIFLSHMSLFVCEAIQKE